LALLTQVNALEKNDAHIVFNRQLSLNTEV